MKKLFKNPPSFTIDPNEVRQKVVSFFSRRKENANPFGSFFGQYTWDHQVLIRRTRSAGHFIVPFITGQGVRGVRIAVRNPRRENLTVKIVGAGPGVRLYVSETEFVTLDDFFLDANDPLDTGILLVTQSELYCATDVPAENGLFEARVLETVIDEGGM